MYYLSMTLIGLVFSVVFYYFIYFEFLKGSVGVLGGWRKHFPSRAFVKEQAKSNQSEAVFGFSFVFFLSYPKHACFISENTQETKKKKI